MHLIISSINFSGQFGLYSLKKFFICAETSVIKRPLTGYKLSHL
jgi:hypothetical protein